MEATEIVESESSSGYAHGPPWLFKGRALYQIHLVKAETARRFIPKELKLVEAFGYTLGGLFLADYSDSPAGVFDELVVIAGIVWNPPTSCAWAARVLVNSHEACKHGRKEIGLPSHFAEFSKKTGENSKTPRNKHGSVWNMVRPGSAFCNQEMQTEIQVTETVDNAATALCNITRSFTGMSLVMAVPESKQDSKWMRPMIRLSLPSFSGKTVDNPYLLKYSCHIECRVRAVEPVKISRPNNDKTNQTSEDQDPGEASSSLTEDEESDLSISVLLSKPILALEFNSLNMRVEKPTVLSCLGTTNSEISGKALPALHSDVTKRFVG